MSERTDMDWNEDDPTPNGHAGGNEPVPDLATLTGHFASLDGKVGTMKAHIANIDQRLSDQGVTLSNIAKALGVEPTKSVPPFREELKSLKEIDEKMLSRVSTVEGEIAVARSAADEARKEAAETKKIVRVGMLENMPQLLKVLGAIALALGGLVTLGVQLSQGQGCLGAGNVKATPEGAPAEAGSPPKSELDSPSR